MIVGIDARIPVATGRGWGRYTQELVDALVESREIELRVLLPAAAAATPWARSLATRDRVRTAAVPFEATAPDEYLSAARGITIESQFNDALALVHSPTRFILPTTVRPLAVTVHDIAPLSDPPFKTRYRDATVGAIDFIRREVAAVMTVSAFTKHELRTHGGLDLEHIEVVHEGVSPVFRPGDATTTRPYVLYVGGAGANKNLDRLLAAMALIPHAGVALVMAGDRSWDRQELQDAFGPHPPPWVHLAGYLTDEELADLYRGAAMCVVPSLHEGFGLPVLESLACGTPLACSRIPVFEEIAGNAAEYFNPLEPNSMARAMSLLLDDRAHVARLRARGLTRARAFTWSETARKTIAVYRRLLREGTTIASTR